jgi:hypothetical protein
VGVTIIVMGADYIVHLACAPKLAFGGGDALAGAKAMMAMLKGRNAARAIAQNAKGQDPSTITVTRLRTTPAGQTEEKVSYADLVASAAPLDAQAKHCQGCPANFLGTPYGCYGGLRYPVSAAGETWLVSRLQPADSPGGFMLLSAIRDFKYDGAPIKRMRAAGMFELKQPAEKVVEKKLLGATRVSGDQIFQAFFSVGPALGAGHCAMLLLMLGALEIDGRVPTSKAEGGLMKTAMRAAPGDERRRVAKLRLGDETPELEAIQDLLRGAYTAWVLDVDLLMDA